MLIALLIIAGLTLFLVAGVFAWLSFLSGRPHSATSTVKTPFTFQLPDSTDESFEISSGHLHVPQVFDESRIRSDLELLESQPTFLAQYIAQAELRFTQSRQIAVLQRWTDFYKIGKEVLDAKAALTASHHAYLQANQKGDVEAKKNEAELAKYEADKEEHITRRVRTVSERKRIEIPDELRSEDEIKMGATQERDRFDIRYSVRRDAGKKLTTLKELQKWFKDERKIIFNDDTLSPGEQDEQDVQLKKSYTEYKRRLNVDVDIYEED